MRAPSAPVTVTVIAALVVALAAPANASDWIDWSGRLELDKRFLVEQDDVPQYPIYHLAFLKVAARPGERFESEVSAQLRYYDFMTVDSSAALSDVGGASPLEFLLWEAWFAVYDLGVKGLDLKMGKQRTALGTADRLNPTDVLDPDDLTDVFAFGRKVPSWAAKLRLSLLDDDLRFEVWWLPGPRAVLLPAYASLPQGVVPQAGGAPPSGYRIASLQERLALPSFTLASSIQAAKIGWTMLTFDWSLSYVHGYDDVPLAESLVLTVDGADPTALHASVQTTLPRMHIVGFDVAGELAGVGVWGEVAVFIPRTAVSTTTVLSPDGAPVGSGTRRTELSPDEPYVKYTVGLDYRFSWGTWVNLQYARGFPTERGQDGLHDYIALRIEHAFLDDTLTLAATGLFETDAFADVADRFGVYATGEISWAPVDNLTLTLGYLFVDGRGETLFGALADMDQAYVKAVAHF